MSDRYTISLYAEGQILDFMYCRNYSEKSLLFTAAIWAAQYHDCTTIAAFQRRFSQLEPNRKQLRKRHLRSLERCSEFPLVIDLTAQCIYFGYSAHSPEELRELPTVDQNSHRTITPHSDFYSILRKYRLDFSMMDFPALLAQVS